MITAIALLGWLKTKREGYNSPAANRIRGAARLSAYCLCVSAVFGGISLHSAKAQAGEQLQAFGREMDRISDIFGENTHMRINGQDLYLANGSSKESMEATLDRFEKYCKASDSVFKDLPKQLNVPEDAKEERARFADIDLSTHRKVNGDLGSVMCIVRGTNTGNGLLDSLKKFGTTQDLGALGKMRYAQARKQPDGSLHVMMLWTEDSLNLGELMPPDGVESKGHDGSLAPRPPASRRIMSVDVVDSSHAAYVYESTNNPNDTIRFYDQRMAADHYNVVDDPSAASRPKTELSGEYRMYERDGVTVFVVAQSNENHKTSVGVVESGISESFAANNRVNRSK